MKVRIKIIEKNNGAKTFIPQAKDEWSVGVFLLNILMIVFLQKRFVKYYGLSKVEPSPFGEALGIRDGDIIHCSDEAATRFVDQDSAMAFLNEYIKQQNLTICSNKEEVLKAKIAKEHEANRIKGEKTKSVKYIKVNLM